MKKMIALIMTLCLLMTAFAAAAETVQPQAVQTADARPVLQDEQAPALVIREVEVKVDDKVEIKRIAATICDASGKVLAEILDDGSFVLTDVHHRESADSRLGHAYDQLMHDVHFSDVEAVDHDEKLKKDINDSLSTSELIAYDLIAYEVFDVMINNPEVAALLTDGAYLEFTVQLAQAQTAPMMIKTSVDGLHWELLDNYSVNNGQVTIRMEKQGVVGFIKTYKVTTETVHSYTQAVMGYAPAGEDGQDMFTPSVSSKPAPELVPTITGDNQLVLGYVHIPVTTDPISLTVEDRLIVTPVAESLYVEDTTIHEHLQWAYDVILEAGEIKNLQLDLNRTIIEEPQPAAEEAAAEETVAEETAVEEPAAEEAAVEEPAVEEVAAEESVVESAEQAQIDLGMVIDEYLKAAGFELTYADLVVRDLFDITFYGEHVEQLYNPETLIELTFEEKELDSADPLVVLHSHDSISWHVVPVEQVRVNNNGTVTLKLDGMGVVAFMVEKPEVLPEAELAVTSPE